MFSKYSFLNLKKKELKNISTKIYSLDECIGGGLPLGRITEIVGEPDSGKTNLLFDIIENLKDEEIITAYISTSGKSLGYLQKRKLTENEKLILCITNDEELIIDFIKKTVKYVDVFIIDAMSNIITSNEKVGFDMNQYQDMPKILSDLSTIIHGEDATLIAVNQFTFKHGELVSRWRNMFQKYCYARVQLNEYNSLNTDFTLLSKKERTVLEEVTL